MASLQCQWTQGSSFTVFTLILAMHLYTTNCFHVPRKMQPMDPYAGCNEILWEQGRTTECSQGLHTSLQPRRPHCQRSSDAVADIGRGLWHVPACTMQSGQLQAETCCRRRRILPSCCVSSLSLYLTGFQSAVVFLYLVKCEGIYLSREQETQSSSVSKSSKVLTILLKYLNHTMQVTIYNVPYWEFHAFASTLKVRGGNTPFLGICRNERSNKVNI